MVRRDWPPSILAPLAGLAAWAWAASVHAQETGQQLASDYCGACHRVTSEQAMPPPVAIGEDESADTVQAPSFRQVAADSSKDRDYLRVYVEKPHYPMPEQLFIPGELDAIIGYILSLRDTPADW
jgi:mono/diheme cytochrome c family protein